MPMVTTSSVVLSTVDELKIGFRDAEQISERGFVRVYHVECLRRGAVRERAVY